MHWARPDRANNGSPRGNGPHEGRAEHLGQGMVCLARSQERHPTREPMLIWSPTGDGQVDEEVLAGRDTEVVREDSNNAARWHSSCKPFLPEYEAQVAVNAAADEEFVIIEPPTDGRSQGEVVGDDRADNGVDEL